MVRYVLKEVSVKKLLIGSTHQINEQKGCVRMKMMSVLLGAVLVVSVIVGVWVSIAFASDKSEIPQKSSAEIPVVLPDASFSDDDFTKEVAENSRNNVVMLQDLFKSSANRRIMDTSAIQRRFNFGDGRLSRFTLTYDLPDFSQHNGMTDEEKAAEVEAGLKVILDKLIADGVLTQEQADKMINFVKRVPNVFWHSGGSFTTATGRYEGSLL